MGELKSKISQTQYQTVRTVSRNLIHLYYEIGQFILKNLDEKVWGSKVIESLAKDLSKSFPEMKGFSVTNLKYMKIFAQTWKPFEIRQQAVDELPWGHNIALFTKLSEKEDRIWYANKCIENGWSRNILVMQMESCLKSNYTSKNKVNNLKKTLPALQSDLIQNTLKDPGINWALYEIIDNTGNHGFEGLLYS